MINFMFFSSGSVTYIKGTIHKEVTTMSVSQLLGYTLVCALVSVTSSVVSSDVTRSLDFIGVGYNILSGNPDGDGGVDPGILVTRRVLDLTYEKGDVSLDDTTYHVPDQVTLASRDHCRQVTPNRVFFGAKAYQSMLAGDVELDGELRDAFSGYEFSKSKRFEQMTDESFVYTDNQYICNRGHARYNDELAGIDRYPLSRSFVSDACALPSDFSLPEYMAFLQDWGTGVIVEVDVGKKIINRFKATDAEFVQYIRNNHADSLTMGGSYQDYASSVVVDIDTLVTSMMDSELIGRYSETLRIGSDDIPEPIAFRVLGLNKLFHKDFWQRLDDYVTDGLCQDDFMTRMSDVKQNVLLALLKYAEWSNVQPSTDSVLQVPVTWPYGTYTLPMPQAGCPVAHFYWRTGSRYQDTEKFMPNNYWSDPCHLQGPYYFFSVETSFCSKTVAAEDDYGWEWPIGAYCILKKGAACPSGFDEGWVLWDDSDTLNSNKVTGELPEGEYGRDTEMEFCCREDGPTNTAVILPTDDNFFLFRKSTSGCQQILGMDVTEEYFRWDGEDDRIVIRDYVGGSTPYNTGQHSDHLLHYCYYYTGRLD